MGSDKEFSGHFLSNIFYLRHEDVDERRRYDKNATKNPEGPGKFYGTINIDGKGSGYDDEDYIGNHSSETLHHRLVGTWEEDVC